MKHAIILVIALFTLIACGDSVDNPRAEFSNVVDATVMSKTCTLLVPSNQTAPSTGETLVKGFVGQQVGSVVGESLGGKTGATLGGAVGAMASTVTTSLSNPEVYCTLKLDLTDGTSTEIILEDYYISSLRKEISLVQHNKHSNWYVIDRLPSDKEIIVTAQSNDTPVLSTVDNKPTVQLTPNERRTLATDLLSGGLEARTNAHKRLTTELECIDVQSTLGPKE